MRRAQSIAAWLFISPWFLGFLLLVAYPFAVSFYWSFCRYDLLSPPQFVGTENYERLAQEFAAGEGVGKALWNTAYFAVLSVVLSVVLGIALAVLGTWPVRGQSVFRTLFYLPSVVPVVATAVLWTWLLEPRGGPVNHLLSLVDLPGPLWLKSPREAAWIPDWFAGRGGFGSKDALVLMSLWGLGNTMVIYLAALHDVPRPLYEAAALDGAGPLRRFWHVTLPLLTPVIFFNVIMGLIRAVQAFTQIYLVSEGRGGPLDSTLMLSLHLFLAAFRDQEMGYASALAWILFVLLLISTLLLFRSARHWVHYQGAAR